MQAQRELIVADDHPMVRRGVRMVLEAEYDLRTVTEAGDLAAVIMAAERAPDAFLVIDLDMPGMQGVESLRMLRRTFPALLIAVLSGHADHDVILRALAAGMNGYILKASSSDELVYAIRTIESGRVYITDQFARLVDTGTAPASSSAAAPTEAPPGKTAPAADASLDLTPRERDVLANLMRGHQNKEIARILGIGEGTVKVHLANIFKALGVQNRTEAVLAAARLGIICPSS